MVRKLKLDEVSASFHTLKREWQDKDGETQKERITEEEFNSLLVSLNGLINPNFKDDEQLERLRFRDEVVISKVELLNKRVICGVYENSYSGHEYKNLEYGVISANSINLRTFLFVLYYSDEGSVYIISQYLGQYGGYEPLKKTIIRLFHNKKNLITSSYNVNNANMEHAVFESVQIDYYKRDKNIPGKNLFGRSGALIITNKEDKVDFSDNVKKSLFNIIDLNSIEKKRIVSDILRES